MYEKEGDVVITLLCNKATLFIRYNLGGRAILHKNCHCACGNNGDIIELTSGRNNDWIGSLFYRYLRFIGKEYSGK